MGPSRLVKSPRKDKSESKEIEKQQMRSPTPPSRSPTSATRPIRSPRKGKPEPKESEKRPPRSPTPPPKSSRKVKKEIEKRPPAPSSPPPRSATTPTPPTVQSKEVSLPKELGAKSENAKDVERIEPPKDKKVEAKEVSKDIPPKDSLIKETGDE